MRTGSRSLHGRLQALESTLGGQPLVLTAADGSTRPVNRRRMRTWFREVFSGAPLSDDTRAVVECVSDNGTDGAMVELLRAIHNSPTEAFL